jgi:hypothetical protein
MSVGIFLHAVGMEFYWVSAVGAIPRPVDSVHRIYLHIVDASSRYIFAAGATWAVEEVRVSYSTMYLSALRMFRVRNPQSTLLRTGPSDSTPMSS